MAGGYLYNRQFELRTGTFGSGANSSGPIDPLEDRSITFYVDNSDALIALTKADSKRAIIMILTRLVVALVARRRITPWSERADSDYNISGAPK